MRQHLSDESLNGYIHHTLTDAQRESLDRHLQQCDTCRQRLSVAERMQRDLRYGLRDELRSVSVPASMQFSDIKPGLWRERFWAATLFWTRQVVAAAGGLAVVLLFFWFLRQNLVDATAFDSVATPPSATYFAPALAPEAGPLPDSLEALPVYEIELTLLPERNLAQGRQRLYLRNDSATRWSDVYLLLPANVYGRNLSLSQVMVGDQPVDFVYELGDSVARLPLPMALAPGERLVIELEFQLLLRQTPFTFNGTLGHIDDIVTLSYFHPALARYDAAGWDFRKPAHGIGGNGALAFYQVQVTAPADMVLAGSGVQTGPAVLQDGQLTTTLLAGPLDHFYLTAAGNTPPILSQKVGATTVNVHVFDAAQADMGRGLLTTTVAALTTFGDLFGPYPYGELDVILTPVLSFPLPVVAYPGVVLVGSRHEVNAGAGLERAVAHGVAGQWFGLAAGGNREPWLTQSLSEQAVYDYMLATYQAPGDHDDWHAADLLARWQTRLDYSSYRSAIGLPVEAYQPGEYYNIIFGRGPMFLEGVAAEMSRDVYTAFRRDYLSTYRWQYATGADFRTLAEDYCECDLGPLWETWVYDTK